MNPRHLTFALFLAAPAPKVQALSLKSQGSKLHFVRGTALCSGKRFGLSLDAGAARFEQKTPLAVEVVGMDGSARWIYGAYSQVAAQEGGARCRGEIVSSGGTRFRFLDRFSRDGDGFRLQRRVEIPSLGASEAGFSSRFGLAWAKPQSARDCDVLMPGPWYRDNASVPPNAFAANLSHQVLMRREDRLGSPLAAARERQSGVSLSLERIGGTPATFAGESGATRLIDERLQVGAIGFLNAGRLEAAFCFPGTEDERATRLRHACPVALRASLGGGALDLMLGNVEGGQRLLVTKVDGKTTAVLYRPRDEEAEGEPMKFTSNIGTLRTVAIDRVQDVSAQVLLAQEGANYEVSIPLSLLKWQPQAGQAVRGDIGVLCGNGFQTTQRAYWRNKATGLTSDLASEAELTPQLWGQWEVKGTP